MSENMLVLIITTQSIYRVTCCGKPIKIDWLPVVKLDKASVCGDRKKSSAIGKSEKLEFINIGIFAALSRGRKGKRHIGRDHMNGH